MLISVNHSIYFEKNVSIFRIDQIVSCVLVYLPARIDADSSRFVAKMDHMQQLLDGVSQTPRTVALRIWYELHHRLTKAPSGNGLYVPHHFRGRCEPGIRSSGVLDTEMML